jgi:DNA-nicking Smr family endonuclease
MTRQKPDPEDIELFRQRMKDVKPLSHDVIETPRLERQRRHIPAAADIPSEHGYGLSVYVPELVDISNEHFIEFRRPGIQDRVYRKMQRGQLPITGEIDLHGMTVNRAKTALDEFMEQLKYSSKQLCVRIIHGKGHGSRDRVPVIKRQTQLWLQCNMNVLAYCSCRPLDGGTGAIYVLVKSIT